MTGIVVDVFKDEVFVFADGRCTDGDVIFTDHDYKIHKLDANNIVTMTGDDQIIDPTIDLILEGKVNLDNLKNINGEGQVIWVTKDKLTVINFDPKETDTGTTNRPGISSYKLSSGPFFFGSGTTHLQGAYYAKRIPDDETDSNAYLLAMMSVYYAASIRLTSMGVLRQYESIKLGSKSKRKSTKKGTEAGDTDG